MAAVSLPESRKNHSGQSARKSALLSNGASSAILAVRLSILLQRRRVTWRMRIL